jgi:ABC-type multidrug transport system fused ATPase/permease subunit
MSKEIAVMTPQHFPRLRRAPVALSALLTLASWQVRRTWFFLLCLALGLLAAVVIACSLPLLSDVLTTAGLRSTLRATSANTALELNVSTKGLSTPVVQSLSRQLDPLLEQALRPLLAAKPLAITSPDFSFFPARPQTNLTIYATSLTQAAPHLHLLQGRLAHLTNQPASELEILLTPQTAQHLGIRVGSALSLELTYLVVTGDGLSQQESSLVTARVVGLFEVPSSQADYWHGEDFLPLLPQTALDSSHDTLLVTDTALLALYDQLRTRVQTDALHTTDQSGYGVSWYYQLDSAKLNSTDLDALIDRLATLQEKIQQQYGSLGTDVAPENPQSSPYLVRVALSGSLLSANGTPSSLEEFRDRIAVARLPDGIFTLLTLALLLGFVSLLTTILVDHQAGTLALVRSRGASRRTLFGAFFLPVLGFALLGLLLGLPLAAWVVVVLAQWMLPPASQDSLNLITGHPVQAVLGTLGYALAVIGAALLTMSGLLLGTVRQDVLALRRETTRSTKRPLWQRLQLDLIAGVIGLVAYGFALYVTSLGSTLQGAGQVLLATPIKLLAPFCFLIGCVFLSLRLFPLLLHFLARFSARRRGAVALLALAQLARAPRQAWRRTLVLVLALALALFTQVFSATQAQHIQDLVAAQTGADFSGTLPADYEFGYFGTPSQLPAIIPTPKPLLTQFQSIKGVRSASVGFSDQGVGGTAGLALNVQAVDLDSFAQTVIWSSPDDFQAAYSLLGQLLARRTLSATGGAIPAIIDQATSQRLQLPVGATFTIALTHMAPAQLEYVVLGVLDRIPTIPQLVLPADGTQAPRVLGGVLVDYQTFVNAYVGSFQAAVQARTLDIPVPPSLNRVWLHTQDDLASLENVRSTLVNPQWQVSDLVDRRALLVSLQTDPLVLALKGVLLLGSVTALLLALCGDLLAAWESARIRRKSFAALRALGTTPRQVAGIFLWEQSLVYLTGILLGCVLGIFLSVSVIPSLTLTDLNANLSPEQFFALQSALPTPIVVLPALPLVGLLLAGLYLGALVIMVQVVMRPMLSRMLRGDES